MIISSYKGRNKMDNILENLYQLHLQNTSNPFGIHDNQILREECDLYNTLYNEMPTNLKSEFVKYTYTCGNRHSEELKAVYEYGFKAAIQLILESTK